MEKKEITEQQIEEAVGQKLARYELTKDILTSEELEQLKDHVLFELKNKYGLIEDDDFLVINDIEFLLVELGFAFRGNCSEECKIRGVRMEDLSEEEQRDIKAVAMERLIRERHKG